MLSAASLSVYALIHGGLTPSIAFTTIAVLSQIEVTLSILPELFSDSLESIVSLSRIEKYLNAPERVPHSDPSDDQIEFVAASIAWPSDAEDDEPDRFVLRDISISFPPHELSVISGKTGSGKSLLLAAILGEIDKVSGMIRRPVPPTPSERFDSTATRGNWILPTAVAFVAQIPWIENASVQDNILFGLPLDKGRYSKTVKVCALEPDLELLPDGDQTEVGGSGINISGGQRWRIAFARALYSRAGILVLDDIFSAVDANVGRQLFEEALTGELGTGRTRILATHHVHLCLPRTKYTVLVGEDGTISHAGLVEDLKRTGSLDEILKVEENHNASNQKVEDVDENKKGDDDTLTLKKILSHRSAVSAQVDNSGVDTKGKLQPRKFVEDEKRETGAIKMEVYKDYFKESGALYYWIPLLLCFSSSSFLDIARSWWVKLWTGNSQTEAQVTYFSHRILLQTPMSNINASFDTAESQSTGDLGYWLGVYLGLR